MLKHFFLLVIMLFSINILAQKNYTISGYVQEESNGENLIGVSVFDKSSNKGTSTNQYGFYSITLPKGKYEILYSFIGLKTIEKSINLENNIRINVSLKVTTHYSLCLHQKLKEKRMCTETATIYALKF